MTCREYIAYEIDNSGFQLDKVLDGLKAEHLDHQLTDKAMTPREILLHLAEAYLAFVTETEGGKHEWGTFQPSDRGWEGVLKQFREQRAKAVAAAMSAQDDTQLKHAHDYIVAHDYYHVGQLALLRVQLDPNWDPYSIYQ
jgi:uncharacterized damage-inducible protein DinB